MPERPSRPDRATRAFSQLMVPAAIFVITFACFAPTLGHGFLRGDDQPLLVERTEWRGFAAQNLHWMFTTFLTGPYMPLSWLSYAVDWSLWGLNPLGYHLTNCLLHGLTAVAVYFLGLRLIRVVTQASGQAATSEHFAAAFAAMIFAIHPLRAESVAWVTERRDVLSGLLFVLALIAWLGYTAAPTPGRYGIGLVLFTLSLLAKATGVTLPVSLLILDVYPLRRLGPGRKPDGPGVGRVLLEKVPFAVVSAAVAILAIHGQRAGAVFVTALPVAHRLAIAAYAAFFYAWKLLVPTGLCSLYERPEPLQPAAPIFILAGAALLAVTVAALALRRRCPGLAAAWLFYLVTLAPVSGLAQAGFQIAADRYSYLPLLGFAILAGGLLQFAKRRRGSSAPSFVAAVILLILAVTTIRQNTFWSDDYAVWRRAVDVSTPFARSPHSLANFAALSAARGDLTSAVNAAGAATQERPGDPTYWRNYAVVLNQSGRSGDALDAYRRAAECQPPDPDALADYAWALAGTGRWSDAAPLFQQAVQLDPRHQRGLLGAGIAALHAERMDEAAIGIDRAMDVAPLPSEQIISVAGEWFAARQPARAIAVLRAAVARNPADGYLALMLAWPLATHPDAAVRDGREALRLCRPLVAQAGPFQAQAVRTLIAALAETGDFPNARAALDQLIRVETNNGRQPVPQDLAAMQSELSGSRPIRRQP